MEDEKDILNEVESDSEDYLQANEEKKEPYTFLFLYQMLPEYKKIPISSQKRFDILFLNLCSNLTKKNKDYAELFDISDREFSRTVQHWKNAGLVETSAEKEKVEMNGKEVYIFKDRRIWLSRKTFPALYENQKIIGIGYYLTINKVPLREAFKYA